MLRRTTFMFLFGRKETRVMVKANFDEKASLPLVVRSAGGSSGLFFLTIVIFLFRSCWLSSISSTQSKFCIVCVSLFVVFVVCK